MSDETQTCRTCGIVKPLSMFYRHKGRKYGRHSQCRVCESRLAKEHQAVVRQISFGPLPSQVDGSECPLGTPEDDIEIARRKAIIRAENDEEYLRVAEPNYQEREYIGARTWLLPRRRQRH